MSAEDHLGSQFLYHGTAARLKPGSIIRPGMRANWGTGAESDSSMDTERKNAFATTEVHEAYRYAETARKEKMFRNVDEAKKQLPPGVHPMDHQAWDIMDAAGHPRRTRGHVYKVEPVGNSLEVDPEDSGPQYDVPATSFQSKKGFRVVERLPYKDVKQSYIDRFK